MRRPRGRPSKRNDPELIASVLAQLNAHSQDSSRVCFDKTEGSWVQVQTLTRDATSIWHEQEELRQNMSLRTMRRIMKQHLAHFKPAWSVSDMCIYCVDLQKKVLPQSEELITGVRQRLEAFMGSYFEAFDEYANTVQLKSKPGLHLRELRHYIWHHSEAQPCQKHSSHSFPCGRLADRARGSGFPQNQRVQLHALEAECCVKLQAQAKLLDGYLFHRSANEHQKPILTKLQEFSWTWSPHNVERLEGIIYTSSACSEDWRGVLRKQQNGNQHFRQCLDRKIAWRRRNAYNARPHSVTNSRSHSLPYMPMFATCFGAAEAEVIESSRPHFGQWWPLQVLRECLVQLRCTWLPPSSAKYAPIMG